MKKALITISIVVGVFLSLQVRSFKKVEFLIQRSDPQNFLAALQTFQVTNENLKTGIKEAEKSLTEIDSRLASETVEKEIKQMQLLAGLEPVTGEGIEIILSSQVKAFWITDLIAQLVNAGAEAVSINNVRLTEETAGFRDIGGGLLMGRFFLRPPFSILVVGPMNESEQAINQNGGIISRMKKSTVGLNVMIAKREKIEISAL